MDQSERVGYGTSEGCCGSRQRFVEITIHQTFEWSAATLGYEWAGAKVEH